MAVQKIYGDTAVTGDLDVTGDVDPATLEGQAIVPIYLNPGSLTGKPPGLIVRT